MSQKFDWKDQGLDRARFEALTKLLRLRRQGQVETPTRFDDDEDDEDDDDAQLVPETDCSSVKALPPTDLDAGRLRRQFLDRLAELIANQKGGRHVAATAMSVGPDSVNVTVARNDGFRPTDGEFLEQVQSLLRSIAATTRGRGSKDALWAALLRRSEPRIEDYLVDVRQLLRRYQQHHDTNHQRTQAVNPSLDSELSELCVAVFDQHSSMASRNDALVKRAHVIHKLFSYGDFESLGFPASASLRTAVDYLGRPRTSFHVLVAAAERLEGFANIQISAVAGREADGIRSKEVPSATSEPWSVAQTFCHLGQPLTDDQIHRLLGSTEKKAKWTKVKLLQKFGELRSPTWEVHVEMQLLQHCILAAPSGGRMVPYFGCSKRSCFLCWSFLNIYPGFKTRGCHGKLYHLWGLPSFEGAKAEEMRKIVDTVRGLEALLTGEILHGSTGALPLAKESTIGPSSIHTTSMPTYERPGSVATVLSSSDDQRLNVRFEATNSDNWRVKKPKFACSRGPITTADILQRDCYADSIPEDPQVREDFGFTRCRSKLEESHLLGLYQGILKILEVTAEEMHNWRIEGVLTAKIIEKFSARPEGSRGAYYPWFLRNIHVLDEGHEVVRDEDDPELYIQRMFARARPYLSPSDQNTPAGELVPWAKRNCFDFLVWLLDSSDFPPTMPSLDLWYDFGFVVCGNLHAERSLANLYMHILLGNRPTLDYLESLGITPMDFPPADPPTCPFEQFWKAWEAGTLMDLFDTYGSRGLLTACGESINKLFPDLREFLSYPGGPESDMRFPRPSVWRLRQFLAIEGANVLTVAPTISRAAIEYGFKPGLDARTRLELHAFYTSIFRRGVRTGEVDGALKGGSSTRWLIGGMENRSRNVCGWC